MSSPTAPQRNGGLFRRHPAESSVAKQGSPKSRLSSRWRKKISHSFGAYDPELDERYVPVMTDRQGESRSALISTRSVPTVQPPTLTELAIRAFSRDWPRGIRPRGYKRSEQDDSAIFSVALQESMHRLPSELSDMLFDRLSTDRPTFLTLTAIQHLFLGRSSLERIRLTSGLPGVPQSGPYKFFQSASVISLQSLTSLILRGFCRFADDQCARVLARCPKLQLLDVAACTLLAGKAATQISQLDGLESLNLDYTMIKPSQLGSVLAYCSRIRSLSIGGLQSFTNIEVERMMTYAIKHATTPPLSHLQSLSLAANTKFTDVSLCRILALTPLLEQLDISNTSCYEPSLWLRVIAPHQLLSFKWSDIDTSAISRVQQNALSHIHMEDLSLYHAWQLQSLDLSNNPLVNAYLKSGPDLGSMAVLSLTSLTLTGLRNSEAQCLSAVLANCARTLTELNLSSSFLPTRAMSAFSGLRGPPLRILNLEKTGFDDDQLQHLSKCFSLEDINLGATYVTTEPLRQLVRDLTQLRYLDLTSCRGIPVTIRRTFFDHLEDLDSNADADDSSTPTRSSKRRKGS